MNYLYLIVINRIIILLKEYIFKNPIFFPNLKFTLYLFCESEINHINISNLENLYYNHDSTIILNIFFDDLIDNIAFYILYNQRFVY